jgi:hypothetical protein
MCPQANVSTMLMAGRKDAKEKIQNLTTKDTLQTVVGFITDSIINADISDLNNDPTKLKILIKI